MAHCAQGIPWQDMLGGALCHQARCHWRDLSHLDQVFHCFECARGLLDKLLDVDFIIIFELTVEGGFEILNVSQQNPKNFLALSITSFLYEQTKSPEVTSDESRYSPHEDAYCVVKMLRVVEED